MAQYLPSREPPLKYNTVMHTSIPVGMKQGGDGRQRLKHIGLHTMWKYSFAIIIQNEYNHIYIVTPNWVYLLVALKPKDINKPKTGKGSILLLKHKERGT